MKKINLKMPFIALPNASAIRPGQAGQPAGIPKCRTDHRRTAALNVIAGHVTRSLPDSLSARGELLAALLLVLPKTHKHFLDTLHLKRTLEDHETTRRQLPFLFLEQLSQIFPPPLGQPAATPSQPARRTRQKRRVLHSPGRSAPCVPADLPTTTKIK
jgi:hypothetical protein